MSRRSESVRGLMPGQACSSCMNRRAPSERSWTISGVHFVAMISAAAATEQLPSCVSFMVRFMARSLLGCPGHSYRCKSGSIRTGIGAVEPEADGGGTAPALVDRPHHEGPPPTGGARREDAGDRRGELRRRDVAACVALGAEAVDEATLRPEEAHRHQQDLGRARLLGARTRLERRHTRVALPDDPLDRVLSFEARRGDREVALPAL